MPTLITENIDQGIRFTLIPKQVNFFVKAILFIITITTITVPFSVLFSSSISKAAIVGAILCGLISVFVLRMFLWNAFGKEVFEIKKNKIFHYIDYQFFKDKLLLMEDNGPFHFSYSADLDKTSKVESEVLDIAVKDQQGDDYFFIISNHEKELTRANIRLSFSKVNEMVGLCDV